MIVLGIDAATVTGLAAIEKHGGRERCLESRRCGADDHGAMAAFLDRWRGNSPHAVIEVPFMFNNQRTTELLNQIAGRWQFALMERQIPWEVMRADPWQKGILMGFIDGKSKRAQRKKMCALWVKSTYGLEVTEDEADAIAMATFVARKRALERRTTLV